MMGRNKKIQTIVFSAHLLGVSCSSEYCTAPLELVRHEEGDEELDETDQDDIRVEVDLDVCESLSFSSERD